MCFFLFMFYKKINSRAYCATHQFSTLVKDNFSSKLSSQSTQFAHEQCRTKHLVGSSGKYAEGLTKVLASGGMKSRDRLHLLFWRGARRGGVGGADFENSMSSVTSHEQAIHTGLRISSSPPASARASFYGPCTCRTAFNLCHESRIHVD